MRFAADGGPWPLRHRTLGLTGNYFFVGRWREGTTGNAAREAREEDTRHVRWTKMRGVYYSSNHDEKNSQPGFWTDCCGPGRTLNIACRTICDT